MEPLYLTLSYLPNSNHPDDSVNAHEVRRIHIVNQPDTDRHTPDWHVELEFFSPADTFRVKSFLTLGEARSWLQEQLFTLNVKFAHNRQANNVRLEFFCPKYTGPIDGQLYESNRTWINRVSHVQRVWILRKPDSTLYEVRLTRTSGVHDIFAEHENLDTLRDIFNRVIRDFPGGVLI